MTLLIFTDRCLDIDNLAPCWALLAPRIINVEITWISLFFFPTLLYDSDLPKRQKPEEESTVATFVGTGNHAQPVMPLLERTFGTPMLLICTISDTAAMQLIIVPAFLDKRRLTTNFP